MYLLSDKIKRQLIIIFHRLLLKFTIMCLFPFFLFFVVGFNYVNGAVIQSETLPEDQTQTESRITQLEAKLGNV